MAFFHSAGTVPVLQDLLKRARMAFFAEDPRWAIMSFVTSSGPGAFLVFNILISASSSSIWIASVMHPSVGVF